MVPPMFTCQVPSLIQSGVTTEPSGRLDPLQDNEND